jgi:heme-degrading monooxygenase HmoA
LVAGPGQTEAMSVVKINAITIPEGMGPQLEGRFAGRAKMVEAFEGFEDFQLLRPTEGEDRYFVYTRWASEENFQAWMNSQDFSKGHGTGQADGEQAPKPVAQGADLMSFIVVEHVVKGA